MKFTKEFLDYMSRRVMRHIEIQIYNEFQKSPFNGAKLPPYVEPVSTRSYMPEPYERECPQSRPIPFSILIHCT